MSDHTIKILNQALELPPIERAELIESLLASFDAPADEEIDKEWAKEAEKRIEAYEAGNISSIPAKDVFEKLKSTSNERS